MRSSVRSSDTFDANKRTISLVWRKITVGTFKSGIIAWQTGRAETIFLQHEHFVPASPGQLHSTIIIQRVAKEGGDTHGSRTPLMPNFVHSCTFTTNISRMHHPVNIMVWHGMVWSTMLISFSPPDCLVCIPKQHPQNDPPGSLLRKTAPHAPMYFMFLFNYSVKSFEK